MKLSKRKAVVLASAGATLAAASLLVNNSAHADPTAQPDPTGGVLADYLQKNPDGSLKTNGKGGYFVQTPYSSNSTARKVGPIYVGDVFTGSGCTASVLDSPSGQLAITADHCTNNIKAGKTVKFSPAATSSAEPYGGWHIDQSFSPTNKVDGAVPDVSVLVIRKKDGKTISQATDGGFKVHSGVAKDQRVRGTMLGYPGPDPYHGKTMSACIGDYTYHPDKGRSAISRVDGQSECWVGGGASGGPFLTPGGGGKPEIMTVLNSSGGSVISDSVPSLIEKAEQWIKENSQ
ncbi:hypothetical protein [Streptomyces nigrescens]|uniref:Uncharacterized protein n=1 Tax=Streptomyces nigrescens TaxID=1920 RepID=A0ABY7IZM8_STRNI|nr:hypothetical protein [Streptomyces nigrescens]WAU03785.1 hypothetical protein STRNI_001971 [Streptomyces nigrescens]